MHVYEYSAQRAHLKRERQLECVDDALETQLQRHRRRIRRRGRHAERVAHCSARRRADRKCAQAREREERKQPYVEVVAKAVLLTSTPKGRAQPMAIRSKQNTKLWWARTRIPREQTRSRRTRARWRTSRAACTGTRRRPTQESVRELESEGRRAMRCDESHSDHKPCGRRGRRLPGA